MIFQDFILFSSYLLVSIILTLQLLNPLLQFIISRARLRANPLSLRNVVRHHAIVRINRWMLSCYSHALDIVLVHFCATRTYLNISPPPYIYLASYKYVLDTSPLTTYIPHIFNITSNVALASLHISSMTVLRVAPACRYESCLTSGTQKMSTCRAYTNELRSRSRRCSEEVQITKERLLPPSRIEPCSSRIGLSNLLKSTSALWEAEKRQFTRDEWIYNFSVYIEILDRIWISSTPLNPMDSTVIGANRSALWNFGNLFIFN